MTEPAIESANEFIGLCTDLEAALKHLGAKDAQGLGDAVRLLGNNRIVARYRSALSSFATLRNAIAHERYRDGTPIAVPLPETIQEARKVLHELNTPTPAFGFSSVPLVADEDDALRDCLVRMSEKDISQVPVRDREGGYRCILTTNAVARWLADRLDERGDVLVENVRVADVVSFLESHEVARFVPRGVSAVDAIHFLTQDNPPVALLITETGKPAESILRVLARSDVPAMQEALQL